MRWLVVAAVAYGVLHHLGTVVSPLGDVGDGPTRWIDWIDLATPYLIVLPVALALRAAAAPPRCWVLFAVGAITYVEGHGIHLAANSIHHVTDADPVYLWDEVVGHYVWYAGALLMLVVLVLVHRAEAPPQGVLSYALAGWTGLTLGTNERPGGRYSRRHAGGRDRPHRVGSPGANALPASADPGRGDGVRRHRGLRPAPRRVPATVRSLRSRKRASAHR